MDVITKKALETCTVVVIGKISSLVGQTVTITDGVTPKTKTFDSSLVVTFSVKGKRKYTVSSATFSKTVIANCGGYVEVELGAFDRLWLYKKGNTYLEMTGGYYRSGDSMTAVGRTYTEFNGNAKRMFTTNGAGLWQGNPGIDVTDYNTLWIDIADAPFGVTTASLVALSTGLAYSSVTWVKKILTNFAPVSGLFYVPMDISTLTGVHWLQMMSNNTASNGIVGCSGVFLSKDKITSLIPKSATAAFPGGVVTTSGIFSGYNIPAMLYTHDETWHNTGLTPTTNCTLATNAAGQWVKVTFDVAKRARIARIHYHYQRHASVTKLQGSNDDINWTDLCTLNCGVSNMVGFSVFQNNIAYKYYRYYIVTNGTSQEPAISDLFLYDYDNPAQIYNDLN